MPDFWKCNPWKRDYMFLRPPPRKHMYRFVERTLVRPTNSIMLFTAMVFKCERCDAEIFDIDLDRWRNVGQN